MKKFFLWILRLFLGGMVKTEQAKEAEKAKRERDAMKNQVETIEQGKELEKKIIQDQVETEKEFEEKKKKRPPDDPFGAIDWNEKK